MNRTEEMNELISKLFDLKARLNIVKDDDEKVEELIKQIEETREKMAEIRYEELMEQMENEERTMKNG